MIKMMKKARRLLVCALACFTLSLVVSGNVEAAESVTSIFTDVYPGYWYVEAVQYAYDNNIMSGMGETSNFAPDSPITRAQFAQVLYNLEGRPASTDRSACTELRDVYEGNWYTDAVCWAYANSIVTGYGDSMTFQPDNNVTREQLATMIYRYTGYIGFDTDDSGSLRRFEDADKVSPWAETAISWAVGAKLVNGIEVSSGRYELSPGGVATRAQTATIFMRLLTDLAKDIDTLQLNSQSIEMKPGETFQLVASTAPGKLPAGAITWTSSNENIATVEKGMITAHANGSVEITAKAGYRTVRCKVSIVDYITEFGKLWEIEDQFGVKINSITKHTKCNSTSNKTGEVVVIVDYSYYNYGYRGSSQDLYISQTSFDVYDGNGTAGEVYPCTHKTYPKVCAPGTNCTASAAYILNEETDTIKLILEQYTSNGQGKKKVIFELNWKNPNPGGGDDDEPSDATAGAQRLLQYVLENGSIVDGCPQVKRSYTVNGSRFTLSLTYREDLNKLLYQLYDESNEAYINFDYSVGTATVGKVLFTHLGNGVITANTTSDMNIRTYTEDTVLGFEVTANMMSGMTDTQVKELANNYVQISVAGLQRLLADFGFTIQEIGFSAY